MKDFSKYSDQPLLDRFFKLFATFTLIEFVIYQVLLANYGSMICRDTSFVPESYTKDVKVFILGAFAVHLSLLLIRLLTGVNYSNKRSTRFTIYSSLVVTIISTTSALLTLFFPRGVCVDAYGYVYHLH